MCDQPHPLVVANIIGACQHAKLEEAYENMKVRKSEEAYKNTHTCAHNVVRVLHASFVQNICVEFV